MNRRQFFQSSMAGAGLLALGMIRSGRTENHKMPTGLLGRTGVKVSKMGLGCAGLRSQLMNVEDVDAIVHAAFELGINYFDTAPNYSDSEEMLGKTIGDIRERIFLVTKTEEASYEGTWKLLKSSLERLRTDYLDLVHLHNIGREDRFPGLDFVFSREGAVGALRVAKKQGIVRFIGASGHVWPSRYHKVLDFGEIDVLMNAVNFVAQHTYDFEHKVWTRAREENIGLVAMKVLGGADRKRQKGFRLPKEYYDSAIRYSLSLPGLSCAVIGCRSVKEVKQAAKKVSAAKPLSAEEAYELSVAGLKLAQSDDLKAAHGLPLI